MNMKKKTLLTTRAIVLAIAFAMTACNAVYPLASAVASVASTTETYQQSDIQIAESSTEEENQPEVQPVVFEQDASQPASSLSYPIVDTGQGYCYSSTESIACPEEGQSFYGQDGQIVGNQAQYQDNGDGTVTDLVTGLMWQQDPGAKLTFDQAAAGASSLTLGGYSDWRLPTIKELYSLILFSGTDVSRCVDVGSCNATPFIDTDYFNFEYGNTAAGERTIDSQWATSTKYVSTTMHGHETMFGVNFADGRIKGYGTEALRGGSGKTFFVIYVRGNSSYGINDFVDNGNGTISDQATGLTWMQSDSGNGLDWEGALNYCSSLEYGGSDDWRLPNAKELHSIVDYTRSPDTSNSAAIDPLFTISSITNEAGQNDYPAFWSSTSHTNSDGINRSGAYINCGRSMGYMNGQWMDVHGAGAQRSDPKSGDPSTFSTGHGPQGDAVRIYNYARCVTGGTSGEVLTGGDTDPNASSGFAGGQGSGTQPAQGGQSGNGLPGSAGGGAGLGSPPQEAIDACSSLSAGASCSVGPGSGTCQNIQNQLACVPEGGPPGGGQP